MLDFLFYLFAAITLVSGLGVVLSRNPVNSALLMVVTFVATAALFVLLEAFLLAALQVLVYAGAIVVLFLFIIMLLDVDEAAKVRPDLLTMAASALAFLLLLGGVAAIFIYGPSGEAVLAEAPGAVAKHYGYELFTRFMLPFQVVGFLLLVAMIGVIVLSKRFPANTGGARQPEAGEAS